MDQRLRQILREHRQSPIPDKVLAEIHRATSFYAVRDQVFNTLEHIFVDLLDYASVTSHNSLDMFNRYGTVGTWISFDIPGVGNRFAIQDGNLYVANNPPGVPSYLLSEEEISWSVIDPWHIRPLEDQRSLLRRMPFFFQATSGVVVPSLTTLNIWLPSLLDILEVGELEDIRIVVDASIGERSEIIGIIQQTMPRATVISKQVYHQNFNTYSTEKPMRMEDLEVIDDEPHWED